MSNLYNRVNWENSPSKNTPINATNLNIMDKGIADVDNQTSILGVRIDSLSEKVDNLSEIPEGSTTADVELYDIRLKANGTKSTSAGNAVREQVAELTGRIDYTDEKVNRIESYTNTEIEKLWDMYDEKKLVDLKSLYYCSGIEGIAIASPYKEINIAIAEMVCIGEAGSSVDAEIVMAFNIKDVIKQKGLVAFDISEETGVTSVGYVDPAYFHVNYMCISTTTDTASPLKDITSCLDEGVIRLGDLDIDADYYDNLYLLMCCKKTLTYDSSGECVIPEETITISGTYYVDSTISGILEDTASISEELTDLSDTTTIASTLTGEGSVITSDSAKARIKGLNIHGACVQDGTPTPASPIEIENVEVSAIRLCGKNLFNNTAITQTVNGVEFTINEDGSICANGTANGTSVLRIPFTFPKAGSYIISGCSGGGSATYKECVQLKGTQTNYNNFSGDTAFDIPENIVNGEWEFQIVVYSGVTVSNLVFYPMIRLSVAIDDSYEPYIEEIVTFDEPICLFGKNGVSDVLTPEGVVRKFIKIQVDGIEGMTVFNEKCIAFKKYDSVLGSITSNDDVIDGYCDMLSPADANAVYSGTIANIFSGAIESDPYKLRFYVPYVTTYSEAKAWLEQYKPTFYLPLATPVEEKFTSDIVSKLKSLKTFHGATLLSVDSLVRPEIDLKYTSDTKMYIDNKFAELEKSILATLTTAEVTE